MSRPYTLKNTIHQSTAASLILEKLGDGYYISMVPIRGSTPTIVNEAISDDNWHTIAAGLTDVLSWRLSERSGADFYVAYEAAPATYDIAFGWISEQSSPALIAVKRKNTATNNISLTYWKV